MPILPEPGAKDPGAVLRAAREARGLSIEDLSRTTKITATILRALEHSQLEKLPATVFTRGFLKVYAREVGLDPEATADAYFARFAPEPAVFVDDADLPRPATRAEVMALDDDTSHLLAAQQARRFGQLGTIVAIVGLAAYAGAFNWLWQPTTPQPAVTGQPPAVVSDVAPAAAPSATDAAPPVAAGPLQIELDAKGPCWISATLDGVPVIARLLRNGDHRSLTVNAELVLRVGNPATLRYSINGQPGRLLGPPEEPVTVRITRENFHDFLNR